MTTAAPCGCDESKALKARALKAELALRYLRGRLRRMLEEVEHSTSDMPGEDQVTLDGDVIGVSLPDFEYRIDQAVRDPLPADQRFTPETWRRFTAWVGDQLKKERA